MDETELTPLSRAKDEIPVMPAKQSEDVNLLGYFPDAPPDFSNLTVNYRAFSEVIMTMSTGDG